MQKDLMNAFVHVLDIHLWGYSHLIQKCVGEGGLADGWQYKGLIFRSWYHHYDILSNVDTLSKVS